MSFKCWPILITRHEIKRQYKDMIRKINFEVRIAEYFRKDPRTWKYGMVFWIRVIIGTRLSLDLVIRNLSFLNISLLRNRVAVRIK